MVSLYNVQLTKMHTSIFVQSGQYTTERKDKNPGALISHISWVYLLSRDEHCTTVRLAVSFPSLGKLQIS